MCTSNRDENTDKQSRFKHLGELHKEWTEAGVSASRVTTLRHLQEMATKPLLKQKHRQKHLTWAKRKRSLLLSGPKSSFQMKVNLAFHLEIKFPESGGRVERHRIHVLEVQCEVSTVSDNLGCHVMLVCGPLCFLKSTVNAAIYQEC